MPDITFIIINFNTKDLLRNCLNSIYDTVKGVAFEIIVIDNDSHDQSREMLEKEFLQVILIKNSRNMGFAAANNQALRIMSGRYAVLLNTDSVLVDGAILNLMDFMDYRLDTAMACGQLLNADGSKQNSIAKFPDLLNLIISTPLLEYFFPRYYPSKRYKHEKPVEIDSGIGACLIVRKRAIDEVGLLDERYFFFFEETDWALQMKKAGWKIYFVPTAFIYHLQGQSVGHSISSRILFYRSRYKYFNKWKGPLYNTVVRTIIFSRLAVNWLFNLLTLAVMLGSNKKTTDRLHVYSQLMAWHLKGCPE